MNYYPGCYPGLSYLTPSAYLDATCYNRLPKVKF
jgi:hypothetical protein